MDEVKEYMTQYQQSVTTFHCDMIYKSAQKNIYCMAYQQTFLSNNLHIFDTQFNKKAK